MAILIELTYEDLCRRAAAIVADAVRSKPDLVLGLATGKTPLGVYQNLIRESIDWSHVQFFSLDEFVGVDPQHQGSLNGLLHRALLDPLRASQENIHLIHAERLNYDDDIRRAGGIDLQILGLGLNGHIAFNEPGTPRNSSTRIGTLSQATRQAYSAEFGGLAHTPRQAITMGIESIMRARRLLLIASGQAKASIIAQALEGPVTPTVPGSVIQTHSLAQIVVDAPAASQLQLRDSRQGVSRK